MKTLGINCAGRWTNVGIAIDGEASAERSAELGRKQSTELPLLVEATFREAGITASELDQVAVGVGPGYYTGIRTGVAYGAALAEALKLPVVPLSSLEIFIWDLRDKYSVLLPIFRAKRLHCYAALYGQDGGVKIAPKFISKDEILNTISQNRDAVIVTPDADRYDWLRRCGNRLIERQSAPGSCCALMGEHYSNKAVKPRYIRGEYLRAPDIGPTSD